MTLSPTYKVWMQRTDTGAASTTGAYYSDPDKARAAAIKTAQRKANKYGRAYRAGVLNGRAGTVEWVGTFEAQS